MRSGLTIVFFRKTIMKTFELALQYIMPIGLTGDGQRSIHTVLAGTILSGALNLQDSLYFFLNDGSIQQAGIRIIAASIAERRLPKVVSSVSVEENWFACDVAISFHPSKAHLIVPYQVVWAEAPGKVE